MWASSEVLVLACLPPRLLLSPFLGSQNGIGSDKQTLLCSPPGLHGDVVSSLSDRIHVVPSAIFCS